MAPLPSASRRRFLQTAFAFSAASLAGSALGCGSGIRVQDHVGDEPTHLLAIGDWGKADSHAAQTQVAGAMKAYVERWKLQTDGLLLLGDNFYGSLPGGVSDPRWTSQFETMYPASPFDCPALAVPGNHDYQRAPLSKYQTELAYAAQGTSRWTMPAQRYSRIVFPQNDPTATLILLDSNMPNEPAQPPPPDASYYTQTEAERQAQLDWLQQTLSEPLLTPFLVVVAHHPVYSNGPHGDNHTLIRDWDPLLRQARVHAYLAGHDHDMQHLEFTGHPTSFVLSGGGGAELNTLRDTGRGPFARQLHGFTHLQITHELMTVRHLDESGNLLHKFTKTPEGQVKILT